MASSTFAHSEHVDISAESGLSHWLPALRPDSLDTISSNLVEVDAGGSVQQITELIEETAPSSAIPTESILVQQTTPFEVGKGFDDATVLDQLQRSNSFPEPTDVPTLPSEDAERGSPWDDEATKPMTTEFEDLVNGSEHKSQLDLNDDLTVAEGQVVYSELPSTNLDGSSQPAEQIVSARFDEGVPLLSAESEKAQSLQNASAGSMQKEYTFESSEGDGEESFFAQLNTTAEKSIEPPSLDRKSTEDVLATLDFEDRDGQHSPVDFFQNLGQNSNSGAIEIAPDATQPNNDDPWAAALNDEDDFLVEDADDLLPDSDPGSPSSFIATLQQGERGVQDLDINGHDPKPQNVYAPHQPSTSMLAPLSPTQLSPKAHGNIGFRRPGLEPMKSFQAHLQQPAVQQRAESFADQSKGGYKSPYDLPLDISKSKRRPQVSRVVSQPQKGVLPPPRSSSMTGDKSLQSPFDPSSSTANSPASLPPPSAVTPNIAARPGTAPQRVASSSSFFEELPVTARPRPSPSAAKYAPTQASMPGPSQSLMPPSPPRRVISTPSQPTIPEVPNPPVDFQLRPPERIDPYASVALQTTPALPPAPTTRYSPAPGSVPGAPKPTPSPRYSPAPPSQPPTASGRYASPPVTAQVPPPNTSTASRYASQPTSMPPPSGTAFQPRTSSPLAYHTKPPGDQSNLMPPPPLPKSASAAGSPSVETAPDHVARSITPSQVPSLPPQQPRQNSYTPEFTPPKRAQTQSPGRQVGPRPSFQHVTQGSLDRPASAHGVTSPVRSLTSYMPTQPAASNVHASPDAIDFVYPTDGSETDLLERWKGAPIITFGFGGQTVTSFPTRTPRYGSGMLTPQMKAGPGDVKLRKVQDITVLPSHVLSFPGPLRGKSKKKDVLNWLTTSITRLEAESPSFLGLSQTVPDPRKRHEEKIILWRLVKILVEFDGRLDTSEAIKAINVILSPEVHAIDESVASQYSDENASSGIYRPRGASVRQDPINPMAAEGLRKHLLKGERKEAVWLAVDNRLWSHALLIASTLEPTVWKQVVQEFVKQEVRNVGNNAESLAALYEIFGGNTEDSIDQLVPPSARAGLQMVSTVDSTGPIRNALDGLDKWKETLALVLNNRSRDDHSALLTLARLLGDYGRVEASHICLIFAKNPAFPMILGGLDDQQVSAVLIGADQRNKPTEIQHDEDAILLTEVYEFATCTLAGTSAAIPLPHLAAYKLQRAKQLADHGYKAEAQAYCDAVVGGLKTGGKVSPYYHALLLTELDDLSNRLKQIPVQGSSWMSKPSIEKVSGSLISRFTNFVAGDDSDAASQTSGKDAGNADIGPFANVAGSPNMSRSGSPSNTYGPYAATSGAPPTAAGSRYAPNGVLSARSSSEFVRGRPSLDSQRSSPGTSYGNEPRQSIYSPLAPSSQTQSPARSVGYQPLGTSPNQQFTSSPNYGSYQSTPPQSSYLPNPTHLQPVITEEQQNGPYMPTPPPEEHSSYIPTGLQSDQQSLSAGQSTFGGYLAPQNNFAIDASAENNSAQPPENTQSYGYEPPADTGYVPYQPDPDSEDEGKKQKPVKKSFMDDDGDDFPRVSNSVPQGDDSARRKANDEVADAAFRAAAEADAQRAKEAAAAKRSSGWFGGWLGGAKKGDASLDAKSPATDQKVHKANLGESKMKLYYDKDLKKWINPDDPDAGKGKGATPPPPRIGGTPGPPKAGGIAAPPLSISRSSTPASASGLMPPSSDNIAAMLPPSVNASLGLSKSTAPSPIGPPPTPGSATAPTPTRTPTSAVSTNAIDDLLGPPTGGRKVSGRGKKAKGGRYIDVMAK